VVVRRDPNRKGDTVIDLTGSRGLAAAQLHIPRFEPKDREGHSVALRCRENHVKMGKGKRAFGWLPCPSEEETKGEK
jgi:hypothetical protein